MEKLKLTLSKSLIINSVKNETYHAGRVKKASNEGLNVEAYHEQAGDETYQEKLLERALSTNLEELKTQLSDYLPDNGQTSADNIYSEEEGDTITIAIAVTPRFNKSYSSSVAKLISKYIEEGMLMDWWKPINKDKSALYAQFLERDLSSIRRCFNKTAPVAPTYQYPTSLDVTGSTIDIGVGEDHTVTYTISDGAIDDIEVFVADNKIVNITRIGTEGFSIVGRKYGHTDIKLYSRHNDQINVILHVFVTDQS